MPRRSFSLGCPVKSVRREGRRDCSIASPEAVLSFSRGLADIG